MNACLTASAKVKAIEDIDTLIVGPVWRALEEAGEPYRLFVCTDHRTPVACRDHTSDPVPFAWIDGPVGMDAIEKAPLADFDESVPAELTPDGQLPLVCTVMDRLLREE